MAIIACKQIWTKCIAVFIILILTSSYASGSCTWPGYFANSTWEDSSKGLVTFTSNEMTGWTFEVKTGSTLGTWRCHSTAWLDSDGYLILITTDAFAPFGADFYGYLCLKLVQITDYSYRYYQYNPEQSQLYNERVYMNPSNVINDKDSLCLESAVSYRPSDSEYKLLVHSGFTTSVKIQCPYVFLGRYDYTYTDVSGVVSCDTSSDVMDTCTDTSHMRFNYTTCPTKIAYSVYDTVWCVDTVDYNDNNYVTLYNGDDPSVDDVTTFRFSCMAISSDRTRASITPNSCKKDQVPSVIPTNVQTGSEEGALLQLSALETCESCPLLSAPQSGTVSYTTDGAVTTATYACSAQYSLAGDATRSCQSGLTWSSVQPTCTCILPSSPVNGTVTVSGDGTSVTYSCHVGFVLNGNENRTCQSASNSWTGNDPTCESCNDFGTVTALNWTLSIEGTTTRAEFTCGTNYTLDGSTNSTCLTSGGWSTSVPACVQCSTAAAPSSGTAVFSTDGVSSTVDFTCVNGYHLNGDSSLTCDVTGTWNGSVPTCDCDDPVSPANGNVSVNGTSVSYTCNTGYTLTGDSQQTCSTDGSGLTGSTPSCGPCQSLTNPAGGLVNLSTSGLVTMASYSCLAGYTMIGERTAYCQQDGSWNVSTPSCAACTSLTDPTSGNVTISTDGVTSQALYACTDNYTLIGVATRTCDTTGSWTTAAPTCLCDHVAVPPDGTVVYDVGNTTAYYSCILGFSLSGSSVRNCATDGSGWSGSDRTCEQCTGLANVTGGGYTLSTNTINTIADFTCDIGYTINGNTRLTCQQNGSWDSIQPTCATCVSLSASTGGNVTLSTSGTVTMAIFTCEAGYTISGTSTLTCDSIGTWDLSAPTCAQCTPRSDPTSGYINITTDGEVTVATYTCSTGYTLIGQTSVTCLPDGNWNLPAPTCECDTPTAPLNGDVIVSGDYVTFSCDVGYTMSGSNRGACQTDGSGWNISTPTCTSCDTVYSISGGNLTFVSDGITTKSVYTCDIGSSLQGSQTVSCNGTGDWTDSQPSCVACPTLTSSVDGGSVAITSNGTATIASYACVNGYYVKGTAVLTCTTNGVWDDSPPTCACDPLSAPSGGSITISDDGLTITFGCDVGYTINGDVNVSCASGGSGWSGIAPSCVQCDNLTNPSGGQVTYETTGTQTSAIYNCSIGSSLSGTIQQPTCQIDGTWDYTNATCVTCASDALALSNGDVIQTTDGHTTVLTYNCSTGYDLVGDVNITCLSTGQYDNSAPVCYCSNPPAPSHGAVTVSADRSIVTYSCESGYIMNGVVNRTCQNNSLGWSGSAPTCNSCDSLTAPSGGTFTLTTNGAVTTAQFSCSVGYTLNGTPNLSCLDDGTWSETIPSCAKCADVTSPNNGNVTLNTDGETTTALYTCSSGYYLIGTGNHTCESSGNWDDVQPQCVCNSLQDPDNGRVNISSDLSTASFSCSAGYTLNGVVTVTCGTDGTGWSGNNPTCVTCPNITGTTNGQYQTVTNGTVSSIEYTCNSGSSLNGSATLVCQSDGSWSTTESACVECPTLSAIPSGNVSTITDGITTTATYTCSTGYSLSGQSTRSCQTNGAWSGGAPYCMCVAPPNITNGQIELTDTNNTLVTYTCDVYYTLAGLQQRSCKQDGTGWNGTEPTCVGCPVLFAPTNGSINITSDGDQTRAMFDCVLGTSLQGQSTSTCGTNSQWSNSVPECVSCGTPTTIDSGNYSMSTNGTMTAITYTCADNYRLSGNAVVICLSDASWDVEFPSCLCEDPSAPSGGSLTTDGASVMYSCDAGYSINGQTSRTCGYNGSGWNGSDPTCTQCQSLSNPQNGSYVISTNGSTSTASFQCSQGTTMDGTSTLVCLSDGTWDSVSPTCVTCDPLTQPANGAYTFTTDGTTTSVQLQCDTGYDVTGTASVMCQSDGTWNLQQTSTCVKTTAESNDTDSLLPVLIGVSVGSAVIIIILSVLLARFVYLYFRGNHLHSYTPRPTVTDSKEMKSSKISHFDETDEPFKIPLVKLSPARAPMGHHHHVLDKGSILSPSPAPRDHESSIFGSGTTPRSPAPSMTGYSPRSITSVSTVSLSHLKANMLPPIKSPMRPNYNIQQSFVSDDADIEAVPVPGPKRTLPKVFKVPKKNLAPSSSPQPSRSSTPVNHILSVMDADETPRDNARLKSQIPVCD